MKPLLDRLPGRASRASSRRAVAVLVLAGLAAIPACNTPNPEVTATVEKAREVEPPADAPLTEPEKIRRLLEVVRRSDHEFIQDGARRKGPAAAEDLEHRLARIAGGVPTARRFVDRVGAGKIRAAEVDRVALPDGTVVPMRDWLYARMLEIEGQDPAAQPSAPAQPGGDAPAQAPDILDALLVIERSGLTFVVPPRRTAQGQSKTAAKEYTAVEFSDMLRKKWEFLGKDIHDLDKFIQLIASESFTTMEPYRVVEPDGTQREFRAWLVEQLERQRQVAQGG